MTELQSAQRRSHTAKAIFGLLLAVVVVAAATAGAAKNTGNPRSGELHVTKECHEFSGQPGGFCTITGSNLNAIRPGMKVVYTNPHVVGSSPPFVLSSDLYVDGSVVPGTQVDFLDRDEGDDHTVVDTAPLIAVTGTLAAGSHAAVILCNQWSSGAITYPAARVAAVVLSDG